MIPQGFIDDLLARVDIVDVIEKFVQLKRSGTNLSARCPFHEEKTPSFTVSQTKQFYHCFGCGAHGSAISFLMEYQGLGFIEAVTELASRVGLSVPEVRRDEAIGFEKTATTLLEINKKTANFYKHCLKNSPLAIDYLKRRGIDGRTAALFGIGFAPDDWQALEAVFSDYTDNKDLVSAGLAIRKDEGKTYDRFRNRIMFPIKNSKGDVIAFGGRVIDSGEPKYLNSPETDLFRKGNEIYGIYESRAAIRSEGRAIVVEGYMDVVALAQAGVKNVVASLGTAITENQIKILLRHCKEIVFCFDGDMAGQKAAWRGLEGAISQLSDGTLISFLFLPQGEDPDSIIRKFGVERFRELERESIPLSDFLFDELVKKSGNIKSIEGKSKLVGLATPYLGKFKAPVMKSLFLDRLSQLSGISRSDLAPSGATKSGRRSDKPSTIRRTGPSVMRHLSELLLFDLSLAQNIEADVISSNRDILAALYPQEELQLLERMIGFSVDGLSSTECVERLSQEPYGDLAKRLSRDGFTRYGSGKNIDREQLVTEVVEATKIIASVVSRQRQTELVMNKSPSSMTDEEKMRYRTLISSVTDLKSE